MASNNPDIIGALWIKNGKYGDFYTGNIEFMGKELKIVISKSQYWVEGGNKPYYIIKLDNYIPRNGTEGPKEGRHEVADARPDMESRKLAREGVGSIAHDDQRRFDDDIPPW